MGASAGPLVLRTIRTTLTAALVSLMSVGIYVGNSHAHEAPSDVRGRSLPNASQGVPSAIQHEVDCMRSYVKDPSHNFTNYAAAIGAPEVTDAIHSGLQPCATFTGKVNGKNQVAQFTTAQSYPGGVQIVTFGGPNAAFLLGGSPAIPIPSYTDGPYVARFNPSTGAQIWRTPLPYRSDQWLLPGSMAVVKDGSIDVAIGPRVYKLDPTTGAITKWVSQAMLDGEQGDANLDGFAVAPDARGTILLKSQNRSTGCTIQGSSAMSGCIAEFGPQPDTTFFAIDPVTLQTITSIKLDQPVTARPIVIPHRKQTYIYLAGATHGIRIIWNPKARTLTQDASWSPSYLISGQGAGDAPVLMGQWVIFNANAITSTTTHICATVVRQSNDTDIHRVCPWGVSLPAGASSEAPASFSTDPENNMFYMQDVLVGGVFGVHLNQSTGALRVRWSRPDWRTSDYLVTMGSAKNRVVSSQYIDPSGFSVAALFNNSWHESLLWANAATGATVAQSAINGPTSLGWMYMPGYAGRMYALNSDGTFTIYLPLACSRLTTQSVSPTSTTTCSTNYSTLPQPIALPTLPPQP
ncbi:unannotated protein [freshwater metagenome]|uniref:Unannotated protein n=1 Tax=freshwater metagenome TaxID=449393 RepID=A0A6J7HCZ0_9ZZZZ|nr:hypothetical protein [Actinomycetota bacterium]